MLTVGGQHQIMRNLDAVLTEGGSSLNDVVEVSVFLTNIEDANDLTPEYIKYFGDLKPARTYVACIYVNFCLGAHANRGAGLWLSSNCRTIQTSRSSVLLFRVVVDGMPKSYLE